MATSLSNAGVLLAYRAPQQETFSTKVYFSSLRSGKNTPRTRPSGRIFAAITSDSPGPSVQYTKTKEQMANEESIYDLSTSWKKLHGEDNWAGLLDPLNMVLRKEILKYGEMVQACYDSFNFDPYSKYCGSCRFPKEEFFNGVGMRDHGYDVTRYLYATSNLNLPNFFRKSRWPRIWSTAANWIGYVSVSDDTATKFLGRRDITIAWRGTVTNLEWIADITATLHCVTDKNIPCPDSDVKVESGFLDLYTDRDEKCEYCNNSARDQILAEVKRLIDLYPNDELSITIGGHSLGSALATLSAYDIVESGLNVDGSGRVIPVCVFSFCGPRVGNFEFKERLEKLGVKMLRIVNVHDIVPKAPGLLVNEDAPAFLQKMLGGMPWAYHHAGVELELDHEHSPYLRKEDIDKIGNSHNLEAILHLIAGYKGKEREFELQVDRDIALVNKSCDFLEDSHLIPPVWWQFEYKGLVRTPDGKWVQPEIPQLEDHLRP